MDMFEGNIGHFNPNAPTGTGDERTPVTFYMGAVENQPRSLDAGRPIFDDVECIRIYTSKDAIVDRPVRENDKQRWPQSYAAWKNTGESVPGIGGTRLEHWPVLSRSQVEELKYFKIFTVEQLSGIPDSAGSPMMGFSKLKLLALAHVELAKGEAPLLKMQAELEERDNKIAALVDQMDKMNKKFERLSQKAA